ncbi:hypothetical protein CEXT_602391 [Caerostris extrusa]|uniref:Uncharacterized protein n=1 Tax=Caerostris extrusa TaxID=172846 RepID=A0AAV4XH13_CAEEX|nr:hypothetical protein CEXT_602391 [Caerostris extrusa]
MNNCETDSPIRAVSVDELDERIVYRIILQTKPRELQLFPILNGTPILSDQKSSQPESLGNHFALSSECLAFRDAAL